MIDFTFIAERYNYWIFIVLMMVGLYTVIARGNLIKKLIGLNLFQTSVFIYYISMGKIAGGTAPILIGGEAHGGGHEEEAAHGPPAAHAESLHAAPAPEGANDLSAAVADTAPSAMEGHEALHAAPTANPALTAPAEAPPIHTTPSFDVAPSADAHAAAAGHAGATLHQAAEVIYTNPLPHVLILTAIVVGVATTAVGLALAVRIREAYGTIEEDELEAADDISEFGHALNGETRA